MLASIELSFCLSNTKSLGLLYQALECELEYDPCLYNPQPLNTQEAYMCQVAQIFYKDLTNLFSVQAVTYGCPY